MHIYDDHCLPGCLVQTYRGGCQRILQCPWRRSNASEMSVLYHATRLCITVQLLQHKPKVHTLRLYHNNVWIYINCYMFRPSLAHHHTVYSCIKQSLQLSVMSGTQNCHTFINVWIMEKDMCTVTGCSNYCAHTYLLLCTYISLTVHIHLSYCAHTSLLLCTYPYPQFIHWWTYDSPTYRRW
jgi:hypothetical protein